MNKDNYYLNIAKEVSKKSTCLKRQYGAVIVKNDEIISTGYNGAPRKAEHCIVLGCKRKNIEHGSHYELCRSVHAEANAIISASRKDMIDATLYLYGEENGILIEDIDCCMMCKRLIINAGIKTIILKSVQDECIFKVKSEDWIENL